MPTSSSQLLDWHAYSDECHAASYDPEESQVRAGLVEAYLLGLLPILKERNRSRRAVVAAQLSLLVSDEAENRRFLNEDAHLLAHKTFTEMTQAAVVDAVAAMEAAGREAIKEEHIAFAVRATDQLEGLVRRTITIEFLDSVFLKLCQTQPQWMWRRLDAFMNNDADGGSANTPAAMAVFRAEAAARALVASDHGAYVGACYAALATAEKRQLLSQWSVAARPTARDVLDTSATSVQAAFRGWRARQAYAAMT